LRADDTDGVVASYPALMNVSPAVKRFCLISLFVAAATPLAAAPPPDRLSGHWEAELAGDAKVFTIDFEFKVSGNTFTGTVEVSNIDREFPIKNGRIRGNAISFESFGTWTGEFDGQELKLTRELDYGKKQHMKAHRTRGQ
jgi:hypothetical protein